MASLLGKRSELGLEEYLTPVRPEDAPHQQYRPHMPFLHSDQLLICAINQGFGDDLYVIRSLKHLQEMWSAEMEGKVLGINWYILTPAVMVDAIIIVESDEDDSH